MRVAEPEPTHLHRGTLAPVRQVEFRKLFELSPDASLLFVKGAVVHANYAAAGLFGAGSSAALIGRRSTELLHPRCVPEVERRVAVFMEKRVRSIRAYETYIRFDGKAVNVETMVAHAAVLDGKAFIVNLRGANARQENERPRTFDRHPSDLLREWALRYKLTSAETFVLCHALRGRSRGEITSLMRVAPSTVKKHVHNLVQKTGDASLNAAVERALREAVDLPRITREGE